MLSEGSLEYAAKGLSWMHEMWVVGERVVVSRCTNTSLDPIVVVRRAQVESQQNIIDENFKGLSTFGAQHSKKPKPQIF